MGWGRQSNCNYVLGLDCLVWTNVSPLSSIHYKLKRNVENTTSAVISSLKPAWISIKKIMKDSSKSCSKKCLTPHVKGHKETYGHRCAPWTPEKWILRWLQGYDIASKQRFVKILTYKESQIIWIHSIFQRKKSTSIFGREEMFPDTIERLVRPTCVRGHRVQGKSHRSFPTHQKTV